MNGRESNENLSAAVLDAAPVGVIIIDSTQADGPFVYVNERFLELTGYSRAEVLDSGYRLLVGAETRQEKVERIERAIGDRSQTVVELLSYRRDGTAFWSRVRLAPLTVDGDVEGTLLFYEDIADQREREPVDLVAVAERCWAAVVTETATLSVQTDQTIRANAERARRLVESLFRNAVEHGDAWEITLGELSDGSGFYIEDDGAGIPSERQNSVFESDTGFGLTVCKRIADAHGWEITVSDGQNGGTRFEIAGVEMVSDGRRR